MFGIMRVLTGFVLFLAGGCGAATGIPVGEATVDASARDTSTPFDVTPPPIDAPPRGDALDAFDAVPPVDADEDTSAETVTCIWGGVGAVMISEASCSAGQACVPVVGCVADGSPGLPPVAACGVSACATECECGSALSTCNCANRQ